MTQPGQPARIAAAEACRQYAPLAETDPCLLASPTRRMLLGRDAPAPWLIADYPI